MTLCVTMLLLAFAVNCGHGGETLPKGIERIHTQCVWDNNKDMVVDPGANAGNKAVVVVIDSGIDYTGTFPKHYHADLNVNVVNWEVGGGYGWGFEYDPFFQSVIWHYDNYDYYNHGTHVAGIAAAVDNDFGVIGTALQAWIYPLKYWHFVVNYPSDEAYAAIEIAAAIDHVVANLTSTCRLNVVVSMSLGLSQNYSVLYDACRNAYDNGILLFASSGNNNAHTIKYPAAYDDCVIAVGAVDETDQRWIDPRYPTWGSNYGPELDFAALGVNINSTIVGGTYEARNGTSCTVPHVAAMAALIWSSKNDTVHDPDHDGWERDEVNNTLREMALDLGAPGKDEEYGWGLINGWVPTQRPVGDINNDLVCDGSDLMIVLRAYDSAPGMPLWDPRADVNIGNCVDGTDLIIVSRHYGEEDP